MRGEFTLSYHYYALKDRRNHMELFLDTDGESLLETWQAYRGDIPRFRSAPAHRRIYLTFAGHVSGGRGRLRILRRGKFVDRRTRCPLSSTSMDRREGDQNELPVEHKFIRVTL
ncbi:MAG: hypothetical protein JNJ69_08925 [Leptospiraceae bacterium]|nr:hypothetical protein [Leptospiraceae bacterium]